MVPDNTHTHRPPLGTWTVTAPSRPGGRAHVVADIFTTRMDGPHHEITGTMPMTFLDRARLRYLFGATTPPVPSQFDVDDTRPRPRGGRPGPGWVAVANLLPQSMRTAGPVASGPTSNHSPDTSGKRLTAMVSADNTNTTSVDHGEVA